MHQIFDFILNNIPTIKEFLLFGPPALIWSYMSLWFAGELKKKYRAKTGYTRKVFHFLIFFTASIIQAAFGLRLLCLFGSAVSLVILFAVVKGSGNVLYEGIAREKDAPKQTYYIIVPYMATLFGGLTSNFFFQQAAIIGYLVTGIGDAIAEPVGTRFGKHTYSVMSLKKVKAQRSLEGSFAVFCASIFAIFLGLVLMGQTPLVAGTLFKIVGLAFICTIVEAVSPHGWDNFTLQIIPSFMSLVLFF